MSSTFDDASLVFIPSGYKTSKAYSVKPSDGSGDLTFSRSNDTATRVNSAGLIEKVRTNLATYSNDFSNASWAKVTDGTYSLVTESITDAFGNTSAVYKFTLLTGSFFVFRKYLASATTQTTNFSLYVKKTNSSSYIAIDIDDNADVAAANNTNWQRISNTRATASFVDITTYSINEPFYVFASQVELGDIATNYIATTSAAVSVGPVANVPRLDYLNSSCGRLILEGQRTNVNIYSESFGLSGSLTLATATYNTTTSPDGYVNADSFLDTTDNNIHALLNVFAKAASPVTYTYSLFVKAKDSGMKIQLSMDDATVGGGDSGIFNPSTGTFITNMSTPTAGYTNPSRSVTSYGNGWYRISFTITTSTATFNRYNAFIVNASNSTVYVGTGTGVYVWGAQMEEGAYATSYIPTLGAAVTRGADACSKTGISSLIGQTEGTIYWEGVIDAFPIDNSFFGVEKTASNFVIRFGSQGSNVYAQAYNGSTSLFFETTSYTLGTYVKLGFAYKAGSYAFYKNGTLVASGTNATTVPACDSLMFNSLWGSVGNGKYSSSQALLFKTRLSNSSLAELTSL